MGHRAGKFESRRCVCGKQRFSNRRRAEGAAHKLPVPGWVYWCAVGGTYHVTKEPPEEYARRRSAPGFRRVDGGSRRLPPRPPDDPVA